MREFVQTDLPEPVVPAMSTCGSFEMLPTMFLPLMSLPTAKAVVDGCCVNSRDSSTVRILTGETSLFGTSTPTTEILLGMGAMRTPLAPSARAISSCKLVIFESFTPWLSVNS